MINLVHHTKGTAVKVFLWGHDSRGGNNGLIVCKNIEYRAIIRIILGPSR